jgi:hypothetical protein
MRPVHESQDSLLQPLEGILDHRLFILLRLKIPA